GSLSLHRVILTGRISHGDFLTAFPPFTVLEGGPGSTDPPIEINDAFLRSLAACGCWRAECLSRTPDVDGASLEDAIIDYCFGAHPNGTFSRELYLREARVSSKFLERLVEVCRKCQLTHMVSLNLSNLRYTKLT
ncbi:hypothetical protein AAVH_37975, partial [Aphelenchoides avenae]